VHPASYTSAVIHLAFNYLVGAHSAYTPTATDYLDCYALPPGTQPPQPSVSAYTADVAGLSDVAQPTWMLPVGAHPAQSGLMHSLDIRPARTQPPLPQPLHMQMPGAQPAYTQSTASQTLSTYTVGTQPVSQQGNSPLYNRYVGGAGHVALDPHVPHLGQNQTLSVNHSPSGNVNSVNRPVGTGRYSHPDIGSGLELLSQAANAVAHLPLDNWVNVGPTPHSNQLSGNNLPVLHKFWQTISGLTQSPVLTFTSLHMSLLLVAYFGLTLSPMVSHARLSVCLVAVWRCAWMVNTQTQFTQIHLFTHSPVLNATGQCIGVFHPWGTLGIWNMGQ